jgi:protein-arginine kinase activator protein McsA
MQVCDRCSKNNKIVEELEINKHKYELCEECAEKVENYIKFSFKDEQKGIKKLLNKFTSGGN